jgi:hypothetical protein
MMTTQGFGELNPAKSAFAGEAAVGGKVAAAKALPHGSSRALNGSRGGEKGF